MCYLILTFIWSKFLLAWNVLLYYVIIIDDLAVLRIRYVSRIPDPDFYPSWIPDLGSRIQKQQQKRGVKTNCCHTFMYSNRKSLKIENYFSLEVLKKKIWPNFQRFIELFTQKIVTKLLQIWVWDLGSGKNLFWIPDPGSRILDPDPQHCDLDPVSHASSSYFVTISVYIQ